MATKNDDATLLVGAEEFGSSKRIPCSGRDGA